MNFLKMEEYLNKLTQQLRMQHSLYCNGDMYHLNTGENWLSNNSFHIHLDYLTLKDHFLLTKMSISNLTDQKLHLKLFVKTFLNEMKNNYVFVSPKQDVLFLTNNHGLFLTSGLMNGSSICQYGVLKKTEYSTKTSKGSIPFYPIGTGDVVGVYSLEEDIKPYDTVVAHTWILSSNTFSEKELLNRDYQLKTRLAFSIK